MVQPIFFRIFWAFAAIFIDINNFSEFFFRLIFIFISQVVRSSASPLCLLLQFVILLTLTLYFLWVQFRNFKFNSKIGFWKAHLLILRLLPNFSDTTTCGQRKRSFLPFLKKKVLDNSRELTFQI